jgi:hypothetical protein
MSPEPAAATPAERTAAAHQEHPPAGPALVQRIGVVVAGAATLVATYVWFAPTTVPANRGLPFGCGSPAHPNDQELGGVVCGACITASRATAAVALAVAVVAVGVVLALRPLARRAWSAPVGLGVLAAVPLLGAAGLRLFTAVEVRSSDGQVVLSCGSAVHPVGDAFARGICADVPGARLAAGLALAAGALLAAVGVPYVWGRTREGAAR